MSKLDNAMKIATFIILVALIFIFSWAADWRLTTEIGIIILFLIAYTLLLVLPIKKFKLGPSGFEGELQRLATQKEDFPASTDTVEEVSREITRYSNELVESDLVLMRLSIEIETTLRRISEMSRLPHTKVGMGQLIRILQQKEILTDQWLLKALDFFRMHRNELIHEGKTSDIEEAIDVGQTVLAKLRQIEKDLDQSR